MLQCSVSDSEGNICLWQVGPGINFNKPIMVSHVDKSMLYISTCIYMILCYGYSESRLMADPVNSKLNLEIFADMSCASSLICRLHCLSFVTKSMVLISLFCLNFSYTCIVHFKLICITQI